MIERDVNEWFQVKNDKKKNHHLIANEKGLENRTCEIKEGAARVFFSHHINNDYFYSQFY